MPRMNRKHLSAAKGFKGHANYRNAHRRILTNPFKSEPGYFKTPNFAPPMFFWNLETASSNQSSVSASADLLRERWDGCPSGEEVLAKLRGISELDAEAMANRQLLEQYWKLPADVRGELECCGTGVIDFHEEPYWGDPGKVAVLHGQKVHDSNYHFVYLTADLISPHYRFTVFITSRVAGFPVSSYLPALLAQLRQVVDIHLILFDGEFPTVKVLAYLDKELIPWNARKSMTKAVKDALVVYSQDPWQLQHRGWHLVELTDAKDGESVHAYVTVQSVHGKLKSITRPIWYSQPVAEAEANYGKRFAIDSGYKDKHAFLARTSSQSWVVRLVLFLVSVLMWNTWRLALAWTFLKGLPPLPHSERMILTKKMVTYQIFDFLMYEGWKL
jgi:hypothetical protein